MKPALIPNLKSTATNPKYKCAFLSKWWHFLIDKYRLFTIILRPISSQSFNQIIMDGYVDHIPTFENSVSILYIIVYTKYHSIVYPLRKQSLKYDDHWSKFAPTLKQSWPKKVCHKTVIFLVHDISPNIPYHLVLKGVKTGAIIGAGTAFPPGAPELNPCFHLGSHCSIFSA